jgi:hypothetical protein
MVPLLFGTLFAGLLAISERVVLPLIGLAVAIFLLTLILGYRLYFLFQNGSYSKTPGAIIYADQLCLNGDGGPRIYKWSAFGEAFISGHDGKPVLQHLHVNSLRLKSYARFSEYVLTPIDYLAIPPAEFLTLLKAQPNFPDKGPVIDARRD